MQGWRAAMEAGVLHGFHREQAYLRDPIEVLDAPAEQGTLNK